MPRPGRPTKLPHDLAPGRLPGTRRVTVTLPEAVIAVLDARAALHRRTRTAEIETILEGCVTRENTA